MPQLTRESQSRPGLSTTTLAIFICLWFAISVIVGVVEVLATTASVSIGSLFVGFLSSCMSILGLRFLWELSTVTIGKKHLAGPEYILWDRVQKRIILRSQRTIWFFRWDLFLRGWEVCPYSDVAIRVGPGHMVVSKNWATIFGTYPDGGEVIYPALPEGCRIVSYRSIEVSRYATGGLVVDGQHQSFVVYATIKTVASPNVARRMRIDLGGELEKKLKRWLYDALMSYLRGLSAAPTADSLYVFLTSKVKQRFGDDIDVLRESIYVDGPF